MALISIWKANMQHVTTSIQKGKNKMHIPFVITRKEEEQGHELGSIFINENF